MLKCQILPNPLESLLQVLFKNLEMRLLGRQAGAKLLCVGGDDAHTKKAKLVISLIFQLIYIHLHSSTSCIHKTSASLSNLLYLRYYCQPMILLIFWNGKTICKSYYCEYLIVWRIVILIPSQCLSGEIINLFLNFPRTKRKLLRPKVPQAFRNPMSLHFFLRGNPMSLHLPRPRRLYLIAIESI